MKKGIFDLLRPIRQSGISTQNLNAKCCFKRSQFQDADNPQNAFFGLGLRLLQMEVHFGISSLSLKVMCKKLVIIYGHHSASSVVQKSVSIIKNCIGALSSKPTIYLTEKKGVIQVIQAYTCSLAPCLPFSQSVI